MLQSHVSDENLYPDFYCLAHSSRSWNGTKQSAQPLERDGVLP